MLRSSVLAGLAVLSPGLPSQDPGSPDPDPDMGWTGVLDEAEFARLHSLRAEEAPPLRGTDIVVADAKAYLSLPEGAPTAAILVIHEWWGLNDHVKHWTDRLAADGYAALAIDLYGGVVATDREGAAAAMRAVDGEAALRTLRAAHGFLQTDERVRAERTGVIGWCFGGGWSLRLAMAEPELDAAVVYYGRLVTDPAQLAAVRAPMLGVFGNKDRGIPAKAVDAFAAAMGAAGRPLELHRYDANHAFANPSSARYEAEHAAAAWAEVRRFFGEWLGPEPEGALADRSRELAYALPEGWRLQDGERPMRYMTLSAAEDLECVVYVLPGAAGGVAANVNRWRGQLGHDPLSEDELAATATLRCMRQDVPYVDVSGAYRGMQGPEIADARMLGVVCPLGDEAVFVKLVGPADAVGAQRAAFEAFVQSMR